MARVDGTDVAHYQGTIDHAAVRAAGVDWFALKATQGTGYLDPTMARNRTGARNAGFRCIGLYHWLSAAADPVAQARWFLQQVGTLAVGEFAMLDAEETGITAGQCLAWCETVEAATRRPTAIYSGRYVAGGTVWQSTTLRHGAHGNRPMIFAAYTTEAKARVLAGVYPWHAWQHSSTATVPGIPTAGHTDVDQVDDWDAFEAACGSSGPAPHPVEDTDMAFIITAPDRNPAIVDASYAFGISGETLTAAKLTVQPVTNDEWDFIVKNSDAKKAADAAMAQGVTVTVPPITLPPVIFPAYTVTPQV